MIFAFIATLVGGIWIGWAWSQRRIDHRWYCGRYHPASNPCKPSSEYLERGRKREARLARADDLEEEAKRLRRV